MFLILLFGLPHGSYILKGSLKVSVPTSDGSVYMLLVRGDTSFEMGSVSTAVIDGPRRVGEKYVGSIILPGTGDTVSVLLRGKGRVEITTAEDSTPWLGAVVGEDTVLRDLDTSGVVWVSVIGGRNVSVRALSPSGDTVAVGEGSVVFRPKEPGRYSYVLGSHDERRVVVATFVFRPN